jgi:hypothetical protein
VLWWVKDQTQPLNLFLAQRMAEIKAPSKFTSDTSDMSFYLTEP